MKKSFLALILVLAFVAQAAAQTASVQQGKWSGSLAAVSDVQAMYPASESGSIGLDIGGTWVGTITFQASVDGTNWFTIAAAPIASGLYGTPVTTTTANGQFTILNPGFQQIRTKMTAYTSGTATIKAQATVGHAYQNVNVVGGTITPSGTQDVNTKQVNGVTTSTGAGAVGTGSQRVAVGQDTTTIAGSAPGTAGTPSTNVVSIQGVGSGTAVPVSGTVTTTNAATGATGATTPSSAVLQGGSDGTNLQAAGVVVGDSGQNSQVVAGARKEVSFTTTTAQAVASTDVSNYRWASVHIVTQGGSSTIALQGSNDNSNWVATSGVQIGATGLASGGSLTTSSTAAGIIIVVPLHTRYFRLNVTGIASGTTAGVMELFASSAPAFTLNTTTNLNNIAGTTVVTGGVAGSLGAGGPVAAGAAITGENPIGMGVSDGTNVQWAKGESSTNPNLRTGIYNGSTGPASLATSDSTDGTANNLTALATKSFIQLFNGGTTNDALRSVQGASTDVGKLASVSVPSTHANAGLVPIPSTAAESNHVIKASAGNLYDIEITTGAAAGFLMLVNATSAPSAGGAAIAPVKCYAVAANSSLSLGWTAPPLYFSTGITAVFSTTGCFTNTASTTAYISGDAL